MKRFLLTALVLTSCATPTASDPALPAKTETKAEVKPEIKTEIPAEAKSEVHPTVSNKPYEALWLTDIDQAKAEAKQSGRPLLVKVNADWCPPCQHQDAFFKKHAEIQQELTRYVMLKIDLSQYMDNPEAPQMKKAASFFKELNIDEKSYTALPFILLIGKNKMTKDLQGFNTDPQFTIKALQEFYPSR